MVLRFSLSTLAAVVTFFPWGVSWAYSWSTLLFPPPTFEAVAFLVAHSLVLTNPLFFFATNGPAVGCVLAWVGLRGLAERFLSEKSKKGVERMDSQYHKRKTQNEEAEEVKQKVTVSTA
uniref:Uncharacterized protein n=1 Tax=Arcella intermedia TaxID=1963864 RepID=A0A6B2LQQ7_9EUKA